MRHRAAMSTAAALGAVLALGTAAHGYVIEMKNVMITSYQANAAATPPLQVPGSIRVQLSRRNRDGSFSGVISQGRTQLSVRGQMRGCSSAGPESWSEASQGRYQVMGSVEEIQIPSPKNAACILALTLPKPPPPPPSGPGNLTTRPKPPEPIILRPSSNDPGPGGDEPKDPTPGRATSNPPPPPPGNR